MMKQRYRFETKRPSRIGTREIDAWNEALDRSTTCDSAFYSYAFARTAEAAGFDAWVTLALDEDGGFAGAFAFQKAPGIKGTLGFGQRIGGDMADYCGPLIKEMDGGGPLAQDFFGSCRLKLFEISHAPSRPAGPGEDLIADDGGPITRLPNGPGGFEAWWAHFSEEKKSRATDLGRRARKIEREVGDLRLELNVVKTTKLLEEIIEEKCRQYRDRDAVDVFEAPANRALLHKLAEEEDPRCQLVVSTLHAGDTWAASHIGLRCGSVLHYWFPVYNEDLKRSSPGRLLILEMLRAMPDEGFDLLDYGLGEGRTKMEFANEVRPFVKGTWNAEGLGGLAARSWQSVMWRFG